MLRCNNIKGRGKKVLFLTAQTETLASSKVRVYQYIPWLEKAGIRCFVIVLMRHRSLDKTKPKFWKSIKILFAGGIKYLKILVLCIFCDVVFIQKRILPVWRQNLMRLLNRNLIFDFDDAIYLPSQECPSVSDAASRKRLVHILRISKGVVVANEYLKKFALPFNKNILIITGPIDCKRYFPKVKEKNKNITIGWIGSPGTAPFLEPLCDVFRKIDRDYPNVVIELIGASGLKQPSHNIVTVEWALDTEVENMHNFDIGIMPLPDNEQASGKGGYKLLQYMAIGIPCVASPVGINSVLIKEGVNGYLADSEDQWYEKLEILINNIALRESMGAKGREIAEQQYCLQVSTPKLIEFITKTWCDGHEIEVCGVSSRRNTVI